MDDDGDGYADAVDCAPTDAAIHPGAPETPDDGVDQDCSGYDTVTCFVDGDGDGFGLPMARLAVTVGATQSSSVYSQVSSGWGMRPS